MLKKLAHLSFFGLRRREPDPPATERFRLELAGEQRTVTLKRSAQARRFTLRVRPGSGDIVVTVPGWAKLADVRTFVMRHTGWIEARLAKLVTRITFMPGAIVPFRGVPHRIAHRSATRGLVHVAEGDDGMPELQVAGDLPHLERRLVDFFRTEAKRDLVVAVERHAGRLGKPVRRVVVRDQTSRWGSCSSNAVLSFSWRLVLGPPWILDYLAAHEVAHLAEMNHGPRFWRILNELCPKTHEAKLWLRANGAALHAMGPAAGKAPDADEDL
jgi:predicted metal-dependent hydrolase